MINAEEILKGLGSLVVVKDKDKKIVYTNARANFKVSDNRAIRKNIKAADGHEYTIEVYSSTEEIHLDRLTNLYTKGTFDSEAHKYYENAILNGEEFCIAFMDLDNFKAINNTYGHINADKILKIVADIIKKSIRNTDFSCRFGGDEFIILLKNTNKNQALLIMEKVREGILNVNDQFKIKQNELLISSSFGIASSNDAASFEEIIGSADKALYEAKQAKGTIVTYKDKTR